MNADIGALIRLLHQTRMEFLRLEREIDELTRMRCDRESRASHLLNLHRYLRKAIGVYAVDAGLSDADRRQLVQAIEEDDRQVDQDSYEPQEGPDAGFVPGVRDWEPEGGPG